METEQIQFTLTGPDAERFARQFAAALKHATPSSRVTRASHARWLLCLGMDAAEKLQAKERIG